MSDYPKRRLHLKLDLWADDLLSLATALQNIATDLMIEGQETTNGQAVSAGWSSSHTMRLSCDPEMTGDRYRTLLTERMEADRG